MVYVTHSWPEIVRLRAEVVRPGTGARVALSPPHQLGSLFRFRLCKENGHPLTVPGRVQNGTACGCFGRWVGRAVSSTDPPSSWLHPPQHGGPWAHFGPQGCQGGWPNLHRHSPSV